jgi:ribosomal protein S15P/S13E
MSDSRRELQYVVNLMDRLEDYLTMAQASDYNFYLEQIKKVEDIVRGYKEHWLINI